MTLAEFLRRLLFHATSAATIWLVLALAVERLIPGVVSPFVNLPFFGLIVLVGLAVLVSIHHSDDEIR